MRKMPADVTPESCPDHWHCDPQLAAHLCNKPDRTRPCPTCSAQHLEIDFSETEEAIRAHLRGEAPDIATAFGADGGIPVYWESPPCACIAKGGK